MGDGFDVMVFGQDEPISHEDTLDDALAVLESLRESGLNGYIQEV